MCSPKAGGGGELDSHTQFYLDFFIALDCLHIPYSEYLRRVPKIEREAAQLYLGLKAMKEKHAMDVAQAQADLERDMARSMNNGYRA